MDQTLKILTDLVVSVRYDDLQQSLRQTTTRHLLDFFGCALGASTVTPVQAARRIAIGTSGGERGATLWGTRQRASADLACFANGLMGRYLDYNDQYSGQTTGHPSDVIPAVVAAAEVGGLGGPEVLTGAVVGYEIFGRLCDAMDIRSVWDHSTLGAIASAGAAANVLGLQPAQVAHALSIATVSNNALGQTRQGELSDWKAGAFPNAARQGLFAALLAREGMTGPEAPFEGPKGFWEAVSQSFELAPFDGTSTPWKIEESALKFHAGCYLALPALDAMIALRPELSNPDDVQSITVHSYRYGITMTADSPAKWRPKTRETADHSLPFLLATGLVEGAVGPEHYTYDRYTAPPILALMDKVTVRETPDYTASFPAVQTQRVEVVTEAGAHLVQQVDYPKGHPANPMSDVEVAAKFRRLVAPSLSMRQTEAVINIILTLEDMTDLQQLFQALAV